MLGLGILASCADRLDLVNPNQQTSGSFGYTIDDLEESVIAAYNHIRIEGTYARTGYTIDITRGDEVWNSSQQWYLPFDDLNVPFTDAITFGLGVTGIIQSILVTLSFHVVVRMIVSFQNE